MMDLLQNVIVVQNHIMCQSKFVPSSQTSEGVIVAVLFLTPLCSHSGVSDDIMDSQREMEFHLVCW